MDTDFYNTPDKNQSLQLWSAKNQQQFDLSLRAKNVNILYTANITISNVIHNMDLMRFDTNEN
jgi:hypothetical protein